MTDLDEKQERRAYIFGANLQAGKSDGSTHNVEFMQLNSRFAMATVNIVAVEQPVRGIKEEGGFFYSRFYSTGGQDDQFFCDDFSMGSKRYPTKIRGLIRGGMSGGFMGFIDEKGKWTFAGVTSQTFRPVLPAILANTLDNTDKRDRERKRELERLVKMVSEHPFEIYCLYRALTKETWAQILRAKLGM